MTNNYFSCGKHAFFFDDRSYSSILDAYEAMMACQNAVGGALKPRVYRKPCVQGEWDSVSAVEGGGR